MFAIQRMESEGYTDPSIRFEDYDPVELSAQATEILKQIRPKGHGAQDGWLTPYQLYERRSREVSGHTRLPGSDAEWLETFESAYFRSGEDVRPAQKGDRRDGRKGYKLCIVRACRQKRLARGLCNTHYRVWRETGEVPQPICNYEGCDRPRRYKAFCAMHESRKYRRGGDMGGLEPIYQSRDGECSIEGCSKKIRAKRLCQTHYEYQRLNGRLQRRGR